MGKTSEQFTAAAAQLKATEKALGWTSSMNEIYAPLHTPKGPACISLQIISDKAYALPIEQLPIA